MQISFMGYKVLNWYERLSWPPVLLAFVVALGVGGKHLYNAPAAEPATAEHVLSFGAVLAGFVITYSAMASDYTMYFLPTVSRYTLIQIYPGLRLIFFSSTVTGSSGIHMRHTSVLLCGLFSVLTDKH